MGGGRNVLSLSLLTIALAACQNNEEAPASSNQLQVSVRTEQPAATRAMVETTTLPSGSSIGITVTENTADATTYDGQTFNNVQYSSSDGINWTTTDAPALSATEAKAVAYYPYSDAVTDVTAIPVAAGETDYMYSGYLTGLSATNPEAAFTMNHAMTALRVNLKKSAEYAPTATVTDITIKGAAFGTAATLNATTGALTNITGQDSDINRTLSLLLSSSYQTNDFIVVPDAAATDLTLQFLVTINEEQYTASTTLTEALKQGYYYTFSLTLSAKGISVSIASVKPWNSGAAMEQDLEKVIPNESFVYAVRKGDEALILPEDIDTTNEEYIAVALVVTGQDFEQKFWIEKNVETNAAYNGNTTFRYSSDIVDMGLTKFTQTGGGGTSSYGYLPKADGSYESTPNLSNDYTTWTDGALSDFSGKDNSAVIVEKSTNTNDMGTVLKAFNAAGDQNQGFDDWYIPACGQLALIYLNVTEINEALTAIGGTTLASNWYWSSSECSDNNGWRVSFSSGFMVNHIKDSSFRVRLVRDLVTE